MLEEMIAARTVSQDHNRRMARNIQRIARSVAIPAAALMLLGLAWFLMQPDPGLSLLEHKVIALGSLFSTETISPLGAMSVGLLVLALLPMINVLYILADSLLSKRWSDAAAAGAVAAILITGILLGHA